MNAAAHIPHADAISEPLVQAHAALLEAAIASVAVQSVLRAIEPFRFRLEGEGPLLDAARLLVDGLVVELDAAHEAASMARVIGAAP